jgi:hypothetical protein
VKLTELLHYTLESSDMLRGWQEVFQWQWNASMTIGGFVSAFPWDEMVSRAAQAFDMAIVVCEYFVHCSSVARSAVQVLQRLKATVIGPVSQRTRAPLDESLERLPDHSARRLGAAAITLPWNKPSLPFNEVSEPWQILLQDGHNVIYAVEHCTTSNELLTLGMDTRLRSEC